MEGNICNFTVISEEGTVSYSRLKESAQQCAELLCSLAEARSNIGIYIPNSTEYITWLYSCYLSGMVAVPIFYGSSLSEVKNIISSCHLQALVYMPPFDAKQMLSEFSFGISLIDCSSLAVVSNNLPLLASKANGDTVLMISTSGSVSDPKRVMLSRNNLFANARDIIASLGYNEHDVFMSIMPLCFASANTSQLMVAFLLGAKLYPYRGILHPAIIADRIKKHSVTSITVTPSLFKMLTDSSAFDPKEMPSLKTVCFGGGPSDISTVNRAAEKFCNLNLTQMYGQTETATRISHMRLNKDKWIPESVGKPIGNMRVRIADAFGNTVPAGCEGRIQVKGESVFGGYYDQPELTSKAFVSGWLNTGDIGKLDSEGNIYVTGREKNLIIYNGFNIYPEEVENVLVSIDGVQDALVYGVPDSNFGERIIADIKLKDGSHIDKKAVYEYCNSILPYYKIPSELNFVNVINTTLNGKKARKRK